MDARKRARTRDLRRERPNVNKRPNVTPTANWINSLTRRSASGPRADSHPGPGLATAGLIKALGVFPWIKLIKNCTTCAGRTSAPRRYSHGEIPGAKNIYNW